MFQPHDLLTSNKFPLNHFVFQTAIQHRREQYRREYQRRAVVKLVVAGTALVGLVGLAVVIEAVPMAYRALKAA